FGAVMLAVGFVVFAIFSLFADIFGSSENKVDSRIQEEFRSKVRENAKKKTNLFQDLSKAALDAATDHESFTERYQMMIQQSGLEHMTLQKAALLSVVTAIPPAFIAYIVLASSGYGLIALLIGAVVGGSLPTAYIKLCQTTRLNKMREQLPDVFDLMSRIIRAGQTMTQAMQAVADEFPQPINMEFAVCSEMMNLGHSPEDSLQDLAKRNGIVEIKIFVLALLIQRETGGNLAEVLDNLAAVVRDRFRINGQIAILTAEGRMQALVLMCLPPAMLIIMIVLNREYASELLNRPELIGGMFVMEGLGYLWIRQIINFDF
ncbi:MAG TPA: type II secretion system F family protein, partial [Pirellulales bacterium]